MGQYLNVGNAGFQAIRKGTYVDKTGLIAYVNSVIGSKEKLICVSRPRRFGKSYAAQMLCAYYDRSCDSESLFQGLAIEKTEDFAKHLNRYHVIYLDITEFLLGNDTQKECIVERLQRLVVKELQEAFPDVKPLENSLPSVLAAVAEEKQCQFVVIIDEWDALIRELQDNQEQQRAYINLLRALFKNSGKTDKMIAAAYITGILPIKKYGTQSAMTDFREFSMLMPEPLEEYVGFTEAEVQQLCAGSDVPFDELKRWYNGYSLGRDVHIYNPKAVMDAVNRGRVDSYWTQSETYESLRMYIERDFDGLREAIVSMLAGQPCKIKSTTFQNDMTEVHSKDDVLTLLVHLGYLTYDWRTKQVSIPNEEIRQEFMSAVENGNRKELAQLIRSSDQLLEDTLAMDEEAVAAAIEKAHVAGTAPNFYNNEQALRSVIRFAYISCIDSYQEIQELPGGKGYADVVYLPKRHSELPALVVELKWGRTADAAIAQIRERRYPQCLSGLAEEILLVGINYDEKTKVHSCRIEKWEMQI